jgi:Tol biopolymer transport system component
MPPDRLSIERHVDKVLSGAEFARSVRMARFLRFIVQSALDARERDLKERAIGVAVFDRSSDWDPKTDTIVRSEARRLRAKLESYYETAGADDGIRVRVPKGGYVPEFEVVESSFSAPAPRGIVVRWRLMIAASLVTTAVLILLLFRRSAPAGSSDAFEIRPFANAFGRELQPSVSPDGKKIAFVWDSGGPVFDIYVKDVQSGEISRITKSPYSSLHPAWSPDGRVLAFLRLSHSMADVYAGAQVLLYSFNNGSERVLASVTAELGRWAGESTPLNGNPGPVWTRDGKALIVTDYERDGGNTALFSIPAQGGDRRVLISSPASTRDFLPRVSPDGHKLAFVRYRSHGSGEIFVADLRGGLASQITFDNRTISGLAWTPDSSHVVFASNRRGSYQLWTIPAKGGEPVRVPADSTVEDVAISPAGDWMAVVSVTENWNIWRSGIEASGLAPAQRFISSSGRNHTPRYSPDGTKIAFVSDRSGTWQVWMCDANGQNLKQLTHFNGPWVGGLNWSPDGREIVLDSRPHGHSGIFVLTLASGAVRTIADDSFEQRVPAWSRDGKSIYFNSDRGGQCAIWKLRLGDKTPVRVSPFRTFLPQESADGSALFFNKDDGELWRAQPDGSQAAPLSPGASSSPDINWTLHGEEVFYTRETEHSGAEFWRVSHGLSKLMGAAAGQLVPATPSLAVSPDGRWLLFAEQDSAASDINLRSGKAF